MDSWNKAPAGGLSRGAAPWALFKIKRRIKIAATGLY